MFEEWLPEGGEAARRTRGASLAADAEGRMSRAEDEGFLRERVEDLLHETASLLERVALEREERWIWDTGNIVEEVRV